MDSVQERSRTSARFSKSVSRRPTSAPRGRLPQRTLHQVAGPVRQFLDAFTGACTQRNRVERGQPLLDRIGLVEADEVPLPQCIELVENEDARLVGGADVLEHLEHRLVLHQGVAIADVGTSTRACARTVSSRVERKLDEIVRQVADDPTVSDTGPPTPAERPPRPGAEVASWSASQAPPQVGVLKASTSRRWCSREPDGGARAGVHFAGLPLLDVGKSLPQLTSRWTRRRSISSCCSPGPQCPPIRRHRSPGRGDSHGPGLGATAEAARSRPEASPPGLGPGRRMSRISSLPSRTLQQTASSMVRICIGASSLSNHDRGPDHLDEMDELLELPFRESSITSDVHASNCSPTATPPANRPAP